VHLRFTLLVTSILLISFRRGCVGSTLRLVRHASGMMRTTASGASRQLRYKRLEPGEIRLLEVQPYPSNVDNTLALDLKHAPLSRQADYAALSYAWGNTVNTVPIEVNGATFEVTGNLHEALSCLRDVITRAGQDFKVWVDAICINQHDVTEKSMQVPRMSQIYSGAERTLIWLDT
jgi:hypothetical protein